MADRKESNNILLNRTRKNDGTLYAKITEGTLRKLAQSQLGGFLLIRAVSEDRKQKMVESAISKGYDNYSAPDFELIIGQDRTESAAGKAQEL